MDEEKGTMVVLGAIWLLSYSSRLFTNSEEGKITLVVELIELLRVLSFGASPALLTVCVECYNCCSAFSLFCAFYVIVESLCSCIVELIVLAS